MAAQARSKRETWRLLFLLFPSLFWLIVFFLFPLLLVFAISFGQRGTYGGVR
jgi:ABC-type sugar transport system permease subunit